MAEWRPVPGSHDDHGRHVDGFWRSLLRSSLCCASIKEIDKAEFHVTDSGGLGLRPTVTIAVSYYHAREFPNSSSWSISQLYLGPKGKAALLQATNNRPQAHALPRCGCSRGRFSAFCVTRRDTLLLAASTFAAIERRCGVNTNWHRQRRARGKVL